MDRGDGEHRLLFRVAFAAHERLQRRYDLRGDGDRVDALCGRAAVAAAAMHGDCKAHLRRHCAAGLHGNRSHRERPHKRANMLSEHRPDMRRFQHAVLHEPFRDAAQLLACLEDQPHRPGKPARAPGKQLRRAKEHRRVRIVPAGVHVPVFRRIGKPRFLPHVQSIHVRAQSDTFALLRARDHRRNAAVLRIGRVAGNAHLLQFLPHKRGGLRQDPARLRHPVQRAVPGNDLRRKRLRFLEEFLPGERSFHMHTVPFPISANKHLQSCK